MVLNRLVVPDGDFTRYPESMYFMKYMKLSGRFLKRQFGWYHRSFRALVPVFLQGQELF
jgi:hypothetical protein